MNRVYLESPRQAGKATLRAASIVAFTGKPGTGKDSAAAVLVNHCRFQSIAFADALRLEISKVWRIDERMLTHRPTKELPLPALAVGMCNEPAFVSWCFESGESLHEPRSPRWVLQQWATYQRRYRPTYYADIVVRWLCREASLGFRRFAITDLRDPVEVAALAALGARLHIVRVHSQRASELQSETATHTSERYILGADFDLCNDHSLDSLRETVLALPPVAALCAEVQS